MPTIANTLYELQQILTILDRSENSDWLSNVSQWEFQFRVVKTPHVHLSN